MKISITSSRQQFFNIKQLLEHIVRTDIAPKFDGNFDIRLVDKRNDWDVFRIYMDGEQIVEVDALDPDTNEEWSLQDLNDPRTYRELKSLIKERAQRAIIARPYAEYDEYYE